MQNANDNLEDYEKICAVRLSGLDMRVWSGGGLEWIWIGSGLEWFECANLDNFNDNWLIYPPGAFSQLFDFCIVPGFWINQLIFGQSYTIFGSFSVFLGSVCGRMTG